MTRANSPGKSHEVADSLARGDTRRVRGVGGERPVQRARGPGRKARRAASQRAGGRAAARRCLLRRSTRQVREGDVGDGVGPPGRAPRAAPRGRGEMDKTAQQLAEARERRYPRMEGGTTSPSWTARPRRRWNLEDGGGARRAPNAGSDSTLRGDQSAVQQGVDKLSARLGQGGRDSRRTCRPNRSARSRKRGRAWRRRRAKSPNRGAAGARRRPSSSQASQALASAAAKMMSDRAQAAGGQSASGFAEMMEKSRRIAKQQGGINSQSSGLLPAPGAPPARCGRSRRARSREAAARAREVAWRSRGGGARARGADGARDARDRRPASTAAAWIPHCLNGSRSSSTACSTRARHGEGGAGGYGEA